MLMEEEDPGGGGETAGGLPEKENVRVIIFLLGGILYFYTGIGKKAFVFSWAAPPR